MSFVYPQFLWALLALSIPIIIHIFNFRRVRRVYFSNVRLLKEVKTETNSFRRLKHLLILLSRLAFLAFLVLAFAQPYLPSANQQKIKNLSGLVSMYVDNSFSMQNELGNDRYLDLATRYVQDLLPVFPESARFQLLTNAFENKEQYPVSAREVEDRLTELGFANEFRDFATVYKRQKSLLDRYAGAKANQVFWFSDFQKSTAGDLSKIQLDTLNQYYLVPIKSEKTPNLLIDSLWFENPFIKALESNRVNVRLKSYSEESYQDLMLRMFIDEQQVSTTSVDIGPRESVVANFNFTVKGEGLKPAKISFEDFPVTFDNEYYFAINASPKVRILQLFASPQSRFVENVYASETVFEISSFNANNLDYNRIEGTELVVLNELENVEGELANKLRAFVQAGGSLLVFPNPKSQNSLAGFLSSLSVGGVRALELDSLGTGRANELELLNVNHPFFQGIFEKVPTNMNMPYANAVLAWANNGDNLLSFKNSRPFFTRFQAGAGKVYVSASPLEVRFSNFAKHALFVPIMYKIAADSKTKGERPAFTFQEKNIRVGLDRPATNQVYKLVKDGLEIVPDQRIVGNELVFDMPEQALPAGHYRLMLDKNPVGLLAFNYDKAESDMRFYTLEEIKKTFGGQKNVQVYDFANSRNFIQDFEQRNLQTNLWKYMLMLALGFFLLEILLIRLL
ncbi:MAG: hypothetical protein HC913_19405 [Microscillaceae bacterium]|nr:hypothetical protein [Microscillaceae bacterium]